MAQYDFSGKTVLISGAGGGLGSAATKRFAQAGANLVVTDFSREMVDLALENAKQCGAEALGIVGDVADENTHIELVKSAVKKFGRLDIALNNAGIVHDQKRLEDIDSAEARRVLEIDVLAVIFAMKHQLVLMRKQFEETGTGGVILNTASVAGIVGAPTLSVYGAAKHAVVGMTKAAAVEYARKGIRINAICPAFTRTNMVTKPLLASPQGAEKAEAKMISNIPMARMGEINEIVQAMLWACDGENSFYTGQTLAMDGGLSAG